MTDVSEPRTDNIENTSHAEENTLDDAETEPSGDTIRLQLLKQQYSKVLEESNLDPATIARLLMIIELSKSQEDLDDAFSVLAA